MLRVMMMMMVQFLASHWGTWNFHRSEDTKIRIVHGACAAFGSALFNMLENRF